MEINDNTKKLTKTSPEDADKKKIDARDESPTPDEGPRDDD